MKQFSYVTHQTFNMKNVLITYLIICAFSCNEKAADKPLAQRIAEAHGIENFDKVEMLEFTFNTQRDTSKAKARHWQWFPSSNEVISITDSSSRRFKRTDTSTAELKKLNAQFTNDEYWLLFPFHLQWDKDYVLTDSSLKPGPVSGKNLRKVTVKYTGNAGFTPGDTYHFFFDEKFKLQEMSFHHADEQEPSLFMTFEDYKNINGLEIAQEHKSKDGKFRLWFTGIAVKTK
jgi:hypothetical protein